MLPRRLKSGIFILEGLNAFATVEFFFYFYFFMQTRHGYGNRANLTLAALNGAVCVVSAWGGGQFGQRFGYFTALKLGWGVMFVAMLAGLCLDSAGGHIAVMACAAAGMCFTWPTLEALTSEGETRAGLQHMLGVYNVVWAAVGAVANFVGGAMLTQLGPKSLFFGPAAIHATQLGLTFWLARQARQRPAQQLPAPPQQPVSPPAAWQESSGTSTLPPVAPGMARKFLRMAWLANPFAYIAINTLVALMPGLTVRLGLSTMLAGFFGSAWCFSRCGAFLTLWLWPGWHYRFRWLLLAYLALVASFAAMLTVRSLPVVVLAQLVFGGAVGLTYYSSLFYSMDVGETKGEHGGFHEAAIALGNCTGPAVGAASLYLLPQHANTGAVAVSALLALGLAGLLGIWRRHTGGGTGGVAA